jgi:hypothetical protein
MGTSESSFGSAGRDIVENPVLRDSWCRWQEKKEEKSLISQSFGVL